MKNLLEGAKQCRYTLFCCVILALFFLTNLFDQVLTGFIFNTYNPDKISVFSIFLICIGGFAIVYVSNWAVSSLMFTEGEARNIFIVLCYTLVPYTVCELLYIFATNFSNNELTAFLVAIRVVGFLWSGVILLLGMFYIHQVGFGKTVVNLILTVVGVLIILFLIMLAFSLVQQIYTFFYTIYNEIVFRL